MAVEWGRESREIRGVSDNETNKVGNQLSGRIRVQRKVKGPNTKRGETESKKENRRCEPKIEMPEKRRKQKKEIEI